MSIKDHKAPEKDKGRIVDIMLIAGILLLVFTLLNRDKPAEPLGKVVYEHSLSGNTFGQPEVSMNAGGWTASFTLPWDNDAMSDGLILTFFYYYENSTSLDSSLLHKINGVSKTDAWEVSARFSYFGNIRVQDKFYDYYTYGEKYLGAIQTHMYPDTTAGTEETVYRFHSAVFPVRVESGSSVDSLHLTISVKDAPLLYDVVTSEAEEFDFWELKEMKYGKEYVGLLVYPKEEAGLIKSDLLFYGLLGLSILLILIGFFGR